MEAQPYYLGTEGRPSSPGQPNSYFRLLWLVKGWGGAAVLPASSFRCVSTGVQVHAFDQSCHFPPASTSCRPAPGGRNLAARSVCPILSARVSVPPSYKYLSLYVRAGPTLVPHHACAPFHRSPSVQVQVRSTFTFPSTPATPSVSTTKSAHQHPRSPFDRPLPPPYRPLPQAHGGALARGARRDVRITATR